MGSEMCIRDRIGSFTCTVSNAQGNETVVLHILPEIQSSSTTSSAVPAIIAIVMFAVLFLATVIAVIVIVR